MNRVLELYVFLEAEPYSRVIVQGEHKASITCQLRKLLGNTKTTFEITIKYTKKSFIIL